MTIKNLTIIRKFDGIKVFFERPSDKHENSFLKPNCNESERISACDLFSLFTANIIKQDVLFIR